MTDDETLKRLVARKDKLESIFDDLNEFFWVAEEGKGKIMLSSEIRQLEASIRGLERDIGIRELLLAELSSLESGAEKVQLRLDRLISLSIRILQEEKTPLGLKKMLQSELEVII